MVNDMFIFIILCVMAAGTATAPGCFQFTLSKFAEIAKKKAGPVGSHRRGRGAGTF